MTSFWLAVFALPLIGAAQAFATGYAYHRMSRRDALHRAEGVGLMLTLISICIMIVKVIDG